MNLRVKAIENQFKPSTLNMAGRQFPDYKVAILVNDETTEEFGYRITKGQKFQNALINDVFTNFDFQRDKNDKIVVSWSKHDREIYGMQLVKPINFRESELIKR